MEAMEPILFMEDFADNRLAAMDIFATRNLEEVVIAPASAIDCTRLIEKGRTKRALLDFQLKDWVGADKSKPLKAFGVDCYNGVEVAKQMLKHSPTMQIGMFSSFKSELKEALEKAGIINNVELIDNASNKELLKYIRQKVETPVVIQPLHVYAGSLPVAVQLFMGRKILNAREKGEQLWKAGKFAWLAGIKTTISSYDHQKEKLPEDWTLGLKQEHFSTKFDTNGMPTGIVEEKSDIKLFKKFIVEQITGDEPLPEELAPGNPVFELFVGQIFSSLVLQNKFAIEKLPAIRHLLSPIARFESQKILFREVVKQKRLTTRKQLYDFMEPFYRQGFPRILELYKCRVDKVSNNNSIIKMESYAPDNLVRKEKFNLSFLEQHHLEESAVFEYTVYTPPMGGVVSHVEPL